MRINASANLSDLEIRPSAKIILLHAPRQVVPALGPETSDENLVKATAQGIRLAMEMLYKRHHLRVYRFALRLTDNAALAEDIVSDVFLDVWRKAGEFQGKSQVSTWLLAITRNKALSSFRRRRNEPLPESEAMSVPDPADDPEVLVCNKDRGELVRMCSAQLPATQREVIDLVYYHEKSLEEVAQIIGAPVGTIKTRMYYARRKLQELLSAAGCDQPAG